MRLIEKSPPPPKLITYSRQIGASYGAMDSDVKNELVSTLIRDQKHLCAYCQQKITLPVKIEHHCDRSICNGLNGMEDKTLDYGNLFAVCWGNKGTHHETICDQKKSEDASKKHLPIELIPTNVQHIAMISYSSTGIIKSSNLKHENEINAVLNLNEKNLKEKRKKEWAKLLNQCFKNGSINKEKLNKLIENNPNEEFPAMYDHIRKVFSK